MSNEESIYEEFSKYLLKMGIAKNKEDIFGSHMITKDCYSENAVIGKVKDYLVGSVFNEKKLNAISTSIYEKYIDYDDECVSKTIRRLFIIYAQHNKSLLNDSLMKWRLNSTKQSKTDDNRNKSYSNNNKKKIKNNFGQIEGNSHSEKKPKKSNQMMIDQKQHVPNSLSVDIQISKEADFVINDKKSKRHKKVNQPRPNNSRIQPKVYMDQKKSKHKNTQNIVKTPEPKVTISEVEREKLFLSLYNDSKERREKLKQMGIEKEQQFNSQYTFTPEMVSKKRNNAQEHNHNHKDNSFFERLQTYDQSKRIHLKRLEQELLDNLPKPKYCKRPIESRLMQSSQDYPKVQREKIRQIENTMLEEQGITFKPILNDDINVIVGDTVIQRNEQFVKLKEAKINAYRGDQDHNCTFKPQINTADHITTGRSNENDDKSQIGKRLYQYQSKYLQNLEEKKVMYQENYPFKPSISKNTDEILQNRQKIMEDLKRKFGNNLGNDDISEERNRNSTEENQLHNNLVCLNDFHRHDVDDDTNKKLKQSRDRPDNNTPFTDDKKIHPFSTMKCDSTQKNTKVTTSADYPSDDRLLELARNFVSNDESLEKFQAKYKNKTGKGIINKNNLIQNNPSTISEEKEYEQENKMALSKPKSLLQNLDYYDSLS